MKQYSTFAFATYGEYLRRMQGLFRSLAASKLRRLVQGAPHRGNEALHALFEHVVACAQLEHFNGRFLAQRPR